MSALVWIVLFPVLVYYFLTILYISYGLDKGILDDRLHQVWEMIKQAWRDGKY